MWGIAIYFAKNAAYSHSYSSQLPSGERQFFLAEVLIGDTIVMGSNGGLRNPPMKQDGVTPYDSIQGNTGGSDVYMIYHSQKAYPRYLVTYTA